MDSLNIKKADNSHHSKVVSKTQNNKTISSSEDNILTSKSTQAEKDLTNFEYEDNEWDIGIGDLIIDLDADIEKSSSTTHLDPSLVIPIATGSLVTTKSKSLEETCDKTTPESKIPLQHIKEKLETTTMSSTSNSGGKGSSKVSIDHQATLPGLKMKIKRTKTGSKTSDSKHEIVKPEQNGNSAIDDSSSSNKKASSSVIVPTPPSSFAPANKRGNNGHRKEKTKDKVVVKDKSETPSEVSCTCGSDKTGNSSTCAKHRDQLPRASQGSMATNLDKQAPNAILTASNVSGSQKDSLKHFLTQPGGKQKDQQKLVETSAKSSISNSQPSTSTILHASTASGDEGKSSSSPPMKRIKCDSKQMIDVCVGTSIGTITEPDCLGPCEPGTSVTLEGIVWHETDGGVLAVNVTWRGKTYVGTLIDCTKHDWAPPRFCDSPTEELDSRLPKGGRAKRGRNSVASANDLINFTETRSSVHSKLRNGGPKGRNSRNSSVSTLNLSAGATGAANNTPSTSPTTFSIPRPEKRRKSKDESPSPFNGNNFQATPAVASQSTAAASIPSPSAGAKKTKNIISPCAISPVLLECPEQDCSKKYKHANGLKYHQSHAHGIIANADDDSLTAPDSPSQRSQSPISSVSRTCDKNSSETNFSQKMNFESIKIISNDLKRNINNFTCDSSSSPAESNSAVHNNEQSSSTENATPAEEANTKLSSTPTSIKIEAKNNSHSSAYPSEAEQFSNDSIGDQRSQDPYQNEAGKNVNPSKNKKNRKSPVPESEAEVNSVKQPEGGPARSPAYSDISDDSNTAADTSLNNKLKPNSDVKKSQDTGSSNPLSLGAYNNMYGPFYQSSSFFQSPENQSTKSTSQTASAGGNDYKSKEHSPLDLMNKVQPAKNVHESTASNPLNASSPVGKMMQHYQHYPYSFIQPSYSYGMENNFAVPPVTQAEDSKGQVPIHIKEENTKDHQTAALNEHPSSDEMRQGFAQKLPKTVVKTEPGQSLPANLSQSPQSINPYQGIYQRHSLAPPLTREDEIQKYFIYPDPRKPIPGGAPANLSSKDERALQSPTTSLHAPQLSSNPHSFKTTKPPLGNAPTSKPTPPKEKTEEKDTKIKQEGQKPTMETQGPPPPPTSQYYLPYMGPGGNPFFPDPSHPMYRNMLVPPTPYNTPYHLQMARFQSPEDLSRNPNTKALDLLQQHANQYYNTHKIHELSERHNQLKSPTNNPKIPVTSSSNHSQNLPGINVTSASQVSSNSASLSASSAIPAPGVGPSPSSAIGNTPPTSAKPSDKGDAKDPSSSNGAIGRTSSPPPQRHVHTHHHTHVGIGYMSGPMGYPAPYVNPAVLGQPAVINPFTNPPSNK